MRGRLSRASWLTGIAAATLPVAARAQSDAVLKVGIGMIDTHAQGYYAMELGLFKKAGLTVDLHQLQFGAIIAAAVAGGDLQIGSSNLLSLASGHQRGIPFVVIAPGAAYDSAVPTEMLVTARDSPIRSVKDLNGKVVGGISVGGLEQVAVSAFVDKNGGDSTTLKFLQVPPSALVAALQQGRISAADLPEPELSAERDNIRVLGNTFEGIAPAFLESGWFTTLDWLAKNKDVARRYAGAVVAAGQWAMANPEAAAAIVQKYVGVKSDRVRTRYGVKLDPAAAQIVLDTAAKYKLLGAVRATDLMWSGR
jgi:NitT/TauT family transport system substrate-binding protein